MEICYLSARSWGHTWKDFLDLPIPLWWLEFDEHMRQNKLMEESLNPSPVQRKSGMSSKEWAEARKRHKEKQKNG